ncbi:MAG: hypothetical protein Q7S01_02780 [bacterium]|nr:hypothetical protein [bacterium]
MAKSIAQDFCIDNGRRVLLAEKLEQVFFLWAIERKALDPRGNNVLRLLDVVKTRKSCLSAIALLETADLMFASHAINATRLIVTVRYCEWQS